MNQNKKLTAKWSLAILGMLMLLNLNGQDMEKYKWQNRILIIKTSNKEDPKYLEQIKEYNNSNVALKERKLLLFEIVGDSYRMTDYQKLTDESQWQSLSDLDESIFDELAEFEVVLIGLDGGVKLKETEVLKKEDLFSIIDSMPMRLREIRQKKSENHKEK